MFKGTVIQLESFFVFFDVDEVGCDLKRSKCAFSSVRFNQQIILQEAVFDEDHGGVNNSEVLGRCEK